MWLEPIGLSLVLIILAEIGDKSQLVCMVLAARHGRSTPIIIGASLAFAILNSLAVIFGTALSVYLPAFWILAAVALLFAGFGIHSLLQKDDEDDETQILSEHSLFITAFLMIFIAELGDKTQIAVAGLAGIYPPLEIWIGAILALIITTILGVIIGQKLLSKLPMIWLHRLAGGFFLCLSLLATWRLFHLT